MNSISGKYGTCYFQDCLEGMQGRSCELLIADPPYIVGIGKLQKDHQRLTKNDRHFKNKLHYNDTEEIIGGDYLKWTQKWFELAKSISQYQIITPGAPNLIDWLCMERPKELMFHYKSNCTSFTHSCRFNRYDPILAYGKLRPFHFRENVFKYPINADISKKLHLKHDCPKEYELWKELIVRSKPKSVIDPFLGSGTTAQICEENGISWIGFELDETQYASDIQTRIDYGMKHFHPPKKQLALF